MSVYHSVLGLSGGESQTEIDAAYRRLAKQYHPDKNNGDTAAAERFKEINSAYTAINNKEHNNSSPFGGWRFNGSSFRGDGSSRWDDALRNLHDTVVRGSKSQRERYYRNPIEDIEENVEDEETPKQGFYNGPNVDVEIDIDLDQAIRGDIVNVETESGYKFDIEIPSCVKSGAELLKRNRIGPDFCVKINVLPDDVWEQANDLDIHREIDVDALDAEMGGFVMVHNYYGKKIRVTIPQGSQNGKIIGVVGAGLKKNGYFGDLLLTLNVPEPEKYVPPKKGRKRSRKNKRKR